MLKSSRLFVVQGPCSKLQELILLALLSGKDYSSCQRWEELRQSLAQEETMSNNTNFVVLSLKP